MPSTGSCSITKAMLTVNSPLRLTNSRVPSSGSTTQSSRQCRRSTQGAAADSSDNIGMSGVRRRNPSMMICCDSRSANVSGELSSLRCTSKPASYTFMMASPARAASGIKASAKAVRSLIPYHTHMPSTALDWSQIDTVLLDMDGTLLDLRFDNWFWLTFVPLHYAAAHGISEPEARLRLAPKFKNVAHTMEWYCIDYWTRELGLEIAALKRTVTERVGYLPGPKLF